MTRLGDHDPSRRPRLSSAVGESGREGSDGGGRVSVPGGSRSAAGIGWDIWRAVIGLSYLAAAVFNAVYTLQRSDELDGYAEGAWFGFLEDFMWNVFIPNGEVLMTLVIAFEVVVGLLILHRDRFVDVGVVASVGWVLVVLPFLAWPYLLTNLVLAAVQGVLLLRRYESTINERLLRRSSAPSRAGRSAP